MPSSHRAAGLDGIARAEQHVREGEAVVQEWAEVQAVLDRLDRLPQDLCAVGAPRNHQQNVPVVGGFAAFSTMPSALAPLARALRRKKSFYAKADALRADVRRYRRFVATGRFLADGRADGSCHLRYVHCVERMSWQNIDNLCHSLYLEGLRACWPVRSVYFSVGIEQGAGVNTGERAVTGRAWRCRSLHVGVPRELSQPSLMGLARQHREGGSVWVEVRTLSGYGVTLADPCEPHLRDTVTVLSPYARYTLSLAPGAMQSELVPAVPIAPCAYVLTEMTPGEYEGLPVKDLPF